MNTIIPLLIAALGVILLIYMILVEDEPGAVPLIMIFIGLAWYFISRSRFKSQNK